MDQRSGFSKEKTRTSLTIDLGEVPLLLTRNSLQDQTLHMGITIRIMGDLVISAKISHSIETMVIDLEMDLSTIRMETGETLETFPVLHWFKGEISLLDTTNQELIPPTKK